MAWVIAGLGNPGEEYAETPHNAGRTAVGFFARKMGFRDFREDKKSKSLTSSGFLGKNVVALVLPQTYMNKSGSAIARFVKSIKAAERLIVVHDDLDLPLGKIKVSYDRGSGGHKGLESIMRSIKTQRFIRVRVGISPSTASGAIRKPEGKNVVNNFILAQFREHEKAQLKQIFSRVAAALQMAVLEGRERAMNQFNTN